MKEAETGQESLILLGPRPRGLTETQAMMGGSEAVFDFMVHRNLWLCKVSLHIIASSELMEYRSF